MGLVLVCIRSRMFFFSLKTWCWTIGPIYFCKQSACFFKRGIVYNNCACKEQLTYQCHHYFVELKSFVIQQMILNRCHSRISCDCPFLIKDWKCHSVPVECNLFWNLITTSLSLPRAFSESLVYCIYFYRQHMYFYSWLKIIHYI